MLNNVLNFAKLQVRLLISGLLYCDDVNSQLLGDSYGHTGPIPISNSRVLIITENPLMNPLRQAYYRLVPPGKRDRVNFLRRPGSFAVIEFPQYDDDGLATRHVPVFLKNEKFNESYQEGKGTGALEGLHSVWSGAPM